MKARMDALMTAEQKDAVARGDITLFVTTNGYVAASNGKEKILGRTPRRAIEALRECK